MKKWIRWVAFRAWERLLGYAPGWGVRDGDPFLPGEVVEASLEVAWRHGNAGVVGPERMWVTALVSRCERGPNGYCAVYVVPHKPTAREWERVWWYWLRGGSRAWPVSGDYVRRLDIIARLAELAR